MDTITRTQVTPTDRGYVAEASDLRWAPGYWPRVVETNIGNGKPLTFAAFFKNNGGARYRQDGSMIVVDVLND